MGKELMNPKFKKLFYIKYTNDLFVNITASYKNLISMKENDNSFLTKNLRMNLSKKKIKLFT
jgi:hypothetical protein